MSLKDILPIRAEWLTVFNGNELWASYMAYHCVTCLSQLWCCREKPDRDCN